MSSPLYQNIMVNLTMCTECVDISIPHVRGHTIKVMVQVSERKMPMEKPNVGTKVPNIGIWDLNLSTISLVLGCVRCGEMYLPTTTANLGGSDSNFFALVLAIVDWFNM